LFKLVESRVKALLAHKESGLISGRQIGVEKECLRVSPEGGISPLAHPAALGSALTNPYITTDYSTFIKNYRKTKCSGQLVCPVSWPVKVIFLLLIMGHQMPGK